MKDPAVTNERRDNETEWEKQQDQYRHMQCENITHETIYSLFSTATFPVLLKVVSEVNRPNDLEQPPFTTLEGFPTWIVQWFKNEFDIRARRIADGPPSFLEKIKNLMTTEEFLA